MSDDTRRTLERIAGRVPVPEPASDRLYRRRDRKQRTRRITAGVLAIAITLLSIPVLLRAFAGTEHPAQQPKNIFSGLGGWIAYGFEPGAGPVGIWAVDPLTRDTVRLSRHGGHPVAWSRDGSKLLIQKDGTLGKDQSSTLWVLGADGSETTLVEADAGEIDGGSFSPDGSTVVYAYGKSDSNHTGIFEVAANGGTPRLLLDSRREPDRTRWSGGFRWPVVSPDGSTIAYLEGGGDHDNALRLMDADGSHGRILLPDTGVMRGAVPGGLAWSPDGRQLAFGSGYAPDEIWVVNADGTGLTRRITNAKFPSWSPDGTRIAFENKNLRTNGHGLMIADVDGTNRRSLSFAGPGPWNPLPRST